MLYSCLCADSFNARPLPLNTPWHALPACCTTAPLPTRLALLACCTTTPFPTRPALLACCTTVPRFPLACAACMVHLCPSPSLGMCCLRAAPPLLSSPGLHCLHDAPPPLFPLACAARMLAEAIAGPGDVAYACQRPLPRWATQQLNCCRTLRWRGRCPTR